MTIHYLQHFIFKIVNGSNFFDLDNLNINKSKGPFNSVKQNWTLGTFFYSLLE